MATKFVTEQKHTVFTSYAVNHPEFGNKGRDIEFQWWKNARSKTAIPWGDDRAAAITAAATAYGVTLTETSPWTREVQFWLLYTPTALP